MSEQSAEHTRSDPFKFLKAVLIGVALGFIAVMVAPYITGDRPLYQDAARTAQNTPRATLPKNEPKDEDQAPRPAPKPAEEPKAEKAEKAAVPDPALAKKPEPSAGAAPDKQTAALEPKPQEPPAQAPASSPAPSAEAPPAAVSKPAPEPVLVPANVVTFPKPFSADDMTAALKKTVEFRVSDPDAVAVKAGLEAASKGDDGAAKAALSKISDRAGRKLVEWSLLRLQSASYKDMRAFRQANPLFPAQNIDNRIETRLFLAAAPRADVLKFFANRRPQTGAGKLSLGVALIEDGEKERGLNLVRQAWTRHDLDADIQARFKSKYGDLLGDDDDQRRKTWIAFKARRNAKEPKKSAAGFKSSVKQRAKHAHRARHKDGQGHADRQRRRHRVDASQGWDKSDAAAPSRQNVGPFKLTPLASYVALKRRYHGSRRHRPVRPTKKDASAKTDKNKTDKKNGKEEQPAPPKTAQEKAAERAFKLGKEASADPAALLSRLKFLQRDGKNVRTWSLLLSLNPNMGGLVESESWWDFKRNEVRRALTLKHPKIAYRIAKSHGALDDEAFSEAEFLSGFVALRFLKNAALAEQHFAEALRSKSTTRDEARALYWLARAQHELGKTGEAKESFRQASTKFFSFYGQLAQQVIADKPKCAFRAPATPSQADIEAFVSEDVVKALMIAKQLDNNTLLVTFFLDMARQIEEPAQMTLLLELAERVAPPHVAVRAAKIALLRGFSSEAYAFPTLLPKFTITPETKKLELALVNALTRQESEFHTGTVSGVGARGLMQLMPQTARLVANAAKVKYEQNRLTTDPSYNVSLGTAYLASLMSSYDGSYIMSLAGYNAGPGRVASWAKEFGDPRSKNVDPIDWIERIPFTETREYVQRIVESTQLYRCRMEEGRTTVQTVQDLHRGKPGKVPDTVQLFDIP